LPSLFLSHFFIKNFQPLLFLGFFFKEKQSVSSNLSGKTQYSTLVPSTGAKNLIWPQANGGIVVNQGRSHRD